MDPPNAYQDFLMTPSYDFSHKKKEPVTKWAQKIKKDLQSFL